MKNNLIGISVLVFAGAPFALACDCCSVFSACNLQSKNEKGFFTGVAEQYTHSGTLLDGGKEISGHGEYLDSSVSQLFVGYNFNTRFSAQLNVPLIYRAYGNATNSASTSGLGDISLTGTFRVWQHVTEKSSFNWSLLGGIKLPTGDAGDLNLPDTALPTGIGGHDLALGSGSVDGIVGTSFSGSWKKVFFNGQMQYAIRSRGDFAHRYANDWTWSGGPGVYLFTGQKSNLALQLVTSGESKGMDKFGNAADEDSAATMVYLGPQVSYTWGSQLSAQVGADLPVSRDNSGLQVVPDFRLRAALTWKF
jgi:hypothetical protein